MNRITLLIVTLSLLATCLSAAPKPSDSNKNELGKFEINLADDLDSDDSNDLIAYDPLESMKPKYETTSRGNNKLKSGSLTDLERELHATSSDKKVASVIDSDEPVMADAERSGTPNMDKIKSIAFNSREVRLVGPNQKEVEMKDDVATKVVVALENLQKEATDVWSQVNEKLDKGWTDLKRSEVWGQVNDKLDKGWTDLKTMVEGVVKPSIKSAEGKQN